MKAPDFRHLKPRTIDECLSLLAEHGDTAQVLAGGQSLMPLLNLRLAAPGVLIDINGLDELKGIRQINGQVTIGALERHDDIGGSPVIREYVPLLAQAAPHIAHVAIRARGTIGGSVALADPAAEWPACCLALGAECELASMRGTRRVAASDFFQGLYTTARADDELVTAVHFPAAAATDISAFREIARRRGDFAIAGLALVARREGAVLRGVRLSMFGVADRAVLMRGAMVALEGKAPDDATIAAVSSSLADELAPPDDPAYPAAYKRRVAVVLLERTLKDLQRGAVHVG